MSLIIIKPDAVQAKQVGAILSRFERKGYTITLIGCVKPERELVMEHYEEHKDKDFFNGLCDSMTDKKIIVAEINHPLLDTLQVSSEVRKLVGKVDQPGTIRGDFAKSFRENAIHASDSYEAFVRETKLWFGLLE